MSGTVLKRACPACSHGFGEIKHVQRVAVPDELGFEDVFAIVACALCGMTFADIANRQSELDESYEQHSIYVDATLQTGETTARGDAGGAPNGGELDAAPPWDIERLGGVADLIAANISRPEARILDAGCATGTFLGLLKERGFTSLHGLEPSPAATAIARQIYGVDAIAGSFVAPPAGIGRFDVIPLQHVLEHIADVRAAIASLFGLLEPGGIAYIEVPDATRYADHLIAPFHDFNTEHINHFSLPVLIELLERAGFETVSAGEKVVRCAERFTYPAVFGMWRRPAGTSRSNSTSHPRRDENLVRGIDRYVAASVELMRDIDARLRDALRDDHSVVIWGAGQLAMKLVRDTVLAEKNVVAIVDGSRQKHGLHMAGKMIVGAADVRALDAPIVVTSIHSADAIIRAIGRELGDDRRVVTL